MHWSSPATQGHPPAPRAGQSCFCCPFNSVEVTLCHNHFDIAAVFLDADRLETGNARYGMLQLISLFDPVVHLPFTQAREVIAVETCCWVYCADNIDTVTLLVNW